MRGPHDIGGLPAGPVETHAHEVTFWEKQIDALRSVIGAKGIVSTHENRRYIEELGHDAYDRLGYYERWTAALCRQMVDRGILTQQEIDERVAELRRRLEEADELKLAEGEAVKGG